MKETIEELKRNKNDVQGSPSPWFDSDEVDTLMDATYNLGKAESTSETIKQERERIKVMIEQVLDKHRSKGIPFYEIESIKQQIGE